jgi:hypothetical protein
MTIKRTYSFEERVRVLTLAMSEGEIALDKLCAATRLQEMEYEVVGENLRLSAQAHLLEIELPLGVELPEGFEAPLGSPLRVQLQRLDSANPSESQWYHGVWAAEGLLMVALPPGDSRPSGEKKGPLGFRPR